MWYSGAQILSIECRLIPVAELYSVGIRQKIWTLRKKTQMIAAQTFDLLTTDFTRTLSIVDSSLSRTASHKIEVAMSGMRDPHESYML